ncbi:MAG: hypothetical protein JWM58_2358 [Rhizobium sp.]|nr:hypothetical protein [Rhizobium sp.]
MQMSSSSLKLAVPALALAVALLSTAAEAGQTRALKIYHLHTHEKATIVFKRNGRYDAAGLKKLNYILRDWRENEPVRMDPRLFDLIWEVYQKSGSHGYINVVCGYRAPETNRMLRSRSKGVADRSQHMLGKALDFYIPDVPLRKLREIGVKFQVGGVGFYPTSGSPFVHMDVGGVRAWPRLPRRELSRLFPDGKTLHRPLEGGTMPGYSAALSDYKRRVGATSIQIAGVPSNNSDSDTKGRSKSLLAALFSNDDENEQVIAEADSTVVAAAKPDRKRNKKIDPDQQIVMASAEVDEKPEEEIKAPVPKIRPAYATDEQPTLETALFGAKKNPAEEAMQAALTPQPADEIKAEIKATEEETPEFADLASYRVPVPQLLGERKRPGDSADDQVLTASVDPSDTATFAAVPVPDIRPEYQSEKMVTADAADDVNVPQSDVKPEEIAALAAQTGADQNDETTDEEDGIADSLDNADNNDQQNNLAEMASLDVPKDTKIATRAFVLPANVADQLNEAAIEEPKVVKKGARPTKADVAKIPDDGSIRTEPKLTRNLIAQWALTKGRVETMVKPVKAPRFVSRTMRRQPTEVYADGFEANAVQIDPARFSGTAVNFMPVTKFAETN